ncbi:hypothetical protein BG005_011988 [Podila minutissima]|nr:hypothetical protein BG005_011988 [Podila minutissima]
MSANAQRTTRPPSSANEGGGSGEPCPPTREASPALSTPQDPIDPTEPADDTPVELEHSATHIVVEHTRDGTVKTHVYAAKGNGQPADLHESVLGRSALPAGDPTWSSHALRADRAVGEDGHEATTEAIDPIAAVSETLSGASSDICTAINLSVQETVAAFRAIHSEALGLSGAAAVRAEQVSAASAASAAAEMDQLREQLVPRLDEIVQYVACAAPRMEEIAQYVASTSAAVERVERAAEMAVFSASRAGSGGGGGSLASDLVGGHYSRSMPGSQRGPSVGSSSRVGDSVHGSEEEENEEEAAATTSMAFIDPQDAQSVDTAACARSVPGIVPAEGGSGEAQDADEILGKMAEIENKIDTIGTKIETIYRVVVDGEVPDSVPQLMSDPAGFGVSSAGVTPEEVEAMARMEAMRREMVAFPDTVQLQLMNENMEALRLALEKSAVASAEGPVASEDPAASSEEEEDEDEVQAPVAVPDEEEVARNWAFQEEEDAKSRALQEEEAERKRALQEEETRWKESIQGSHAKQNELIELLGAKIDGSSHTNKLAMKTFWVFMRLLFQHAKDMGSKMDQLQRDFEHRTTHDQESHTRLSGMLTSIQSDLQTLARQLPESLADNAEIQRIVDQTIAGIQSSIVFAAVPPVPPVEPEDQLAEEAMPDAQDGQGTVAETHAGASVARSRSLPIPGPDISPAPLDKDTVSEVETFDADASTTDAAGAVEAVEPTTEEVSASQEENDSDPQLMFPQLEELIATIKSLQDHMAAMTAQYADLYAAVNGDAPPAGADSVAAREMSDPAQTASSPEWQDAVDDEAQESSASASASLPPPPPPGKPAEGYGPVPRSIARPPSPSVAEEPVLEEMGSPAEVPEDPTDGSSVSVAPSLSAPVTVQDLERMNDLLGSIAGLITTSAIEIKSGQKFLHNELQAEIGKVLHALHSPASHDTDEPETPEQQQQEREGQEVQARAVAEEAAQRQAEEQARSLECIGMIPNLTAALQSVNDHLANKMNTLREDVAGTGAQVREQMQIMHQDVRKLITGSIEDSGTLDVVRTVLEGLAAQHASRSDEVLEQLAEGAKSAEVQELFQELKAAQEAALQQQQDTILDKLEEWCKGHGEHCEAVEDWHRRHDARGEATEKWHASQDERYKGFDQWRLLYNDQCAGEDTWRQRVDERHAGYEELQRKSLEVLQRIEHAPKCRCVSTSGEITPTDAEACAEEGIDTKSVATSNGNGPEDSADPASGDRELTENQAISSAESSSSATTTCPSTPNRQRHARELCNLFRSFMNEVAPGHDSNCCGLPSCRSRSTADEDTPAAPDLDSEDNEHAAIRGAPSVTVIPPSEGSKHEEDEESSDRHMDQDPSGLNEHTAPVESVSATGRDYCRELYEMLLPHFAPKEQDHSSAAGSGRGFTEEDGTGAPSVHAACPANEANEATEVVSKQLAELQEQYDAAIADNEELRAQNTGMVSTIMDKDRISNALMDDKVKLEEVLQEKDDQLAKQKEKYRETKRTMERLYRDELGLGDLPNDATATEDPGLSSRHQLVKQASEQLRQTVDEFEERHAVLRAEISALEDQKSLLQRQIAEMAPPPIQVHSQVVPPSISSRRTGVRARGERESVSDDEVEDADDDYVEVGETSKKGSSGRSRPLSMVGSSPARQATAGTSGSAGTRGSRPFTRQGKRAAYSRSQSQGPKRRSGEAVYALSRVPQLEADIRICKDGVLSETLLSSKTVLTEEQLAKVRMAKKSTDDGKEDDDGEEEEVWSLSCNFRVNLVPSP